MIFTHHLSSDSKDDPFIEKTSNIGVGSKLKRSTKKVINALRIQKEKDRGFSDEYHTYESGSQPLKLSLAIVLAYLFIGALTFSNWMEDWTLIDAMYFTVTTFTTVGYGDLYPISTGQRIWGTVFVLFGITVLGGIALSVIFDRLFSSFEEATKEMESNTHKYYMDLFDDDGLAVKENKNKKETSSTEKSGLPSNIFTILLTLIIPSLLIGYIEGWSIWMSLYFCAITATTVGFGDLSPQSQWTRLIAVFYLPLCVALMAQIIGKITDVFMKRKTEKNEKKFLNRELTLKDICEMDAEGNGAVSYDEFLSFMLITMGKVEKEDIEQLKELYRRLDSNNDKTLSIHDLFIKAHGRNID